ncbi:unnamed protein product [Boreogadus saida]
MLSHHESEPERRSTGYLAEDVPEGTRVQGLDVHSKLSFVGVIFKTPGMPETTAMPRDDAQALRFRAYELTWSLISDRVDFCDQGDSEE